MPKPVAGLPAENTWETRFLARLEEELAKQGWSDTRLEGALARVGYPLPAASIWKIRKGTPRRRINLDDAYAIAQALGYASVDEFVSGKDVRAILDEFADLRDAIRRLDQARGACYDSANRLYGMLADEERRRGHLAANPQLKAEAAPLAEQALIDLADASGELQGNEGLVPVTDWLQQIRVALGRVVK